MTCLVLFLVTGIEKLTIASPATATSSYGTDRVVLELPVSNGRIQGAAVIVSGFEPDRLTTEIKNRTESGDRSFHSSKMKEVLWE